MIHYDDQQTERYEKRQQWLSDNGRGEGDVMDEGSGEFILEEVDDGEDVRMRPVYLPKELQTQWVPLKN